MAEPPHRTGYAEYKPVQLHTAIAAGLQVPRTLVTNDPDNARAVVSEVGEAIYKPLGGTAAVTDVEGTHQVFATRVTPEQAGGPSVAHTCTCSSSGCPRTTRSG